MIRINGYTYLERKWRAIEHMMPKVKLYKGNAKAHAYLRGKYACALTRSYRGEIRTAFTVESKSFAADWSVGKALLGRLSVMARVLSITSRAQSISLIGGIITAQNVRSTHNKGIGRAMTARVRVCSSVNAKATTAKGYSANGNVLAQVAFSGEASTAKTAIVGGYVKSRVFGGGRLTVLGEFDYAYGRLIGHTAVHSIIHRAATSKMTARVRACGTAAARADISAGDSASGNVSAQGRATATITRARRGVIADFIGHSISEYMNKSIERASYVEVTNG